MAYVLNNTLSDTYANSYCDVTYGDDYWNDHYDTVKSALWQALDDQQKAILLIRACRVVETVRFTVSDMLRIDYALEYDRHSGKVIALNIDELPPVKYYYYQSLQFPRVRDRDLITGLLYIPEPILMAQCEQAVYLLSFDDTVLATKLQGVSRDQITAGPISSRQTIDQMGTSLGPAALEFLRPYMLRVSSSMRRG